MRSSALIARIVTVVVAAVLLTALFTTLLFGVLSRASFTRVKEDELYPRAVALGELVAAFGDQLKPEFFASIVDSNAGDESLLGAYGLILDREGRVLVRSNALVEDLALWFQPVIRRTLAGESLCTSDIDWFPSKNVVFVSTPIWTDGQVQGAVFLFVPLYEVLTALGSLTGSLGLSLLLVFPAMFLMVYFLARRIVNPLKEMRNVAMAMAAGNFKVRASDEWRGEVGQLGRSLNYMAGELSTTISDLEFERNRLRHLIDGLSEGIVAVDALGRVTHKNPALKEILNLSEEVYADEGTIPHAAIAGDFEQVMREGETVTRQLEVADKVIRVTVTPIHDEAGGIAGAVGLFSDITQSERLERTRRDYVANVSHELRTPLTAMRGLIEPLRDDMVQDKATRQRYYDIILRETLRLSRLIDDLMELSRLQSGALSVQMEPVDLQEMLLDICERYSQVARERDHYFTWTEAVGQCPRVVTNADRIEQLMVILLDNAMKYSGEGCTVSVDATWDEERVIVYVRDDGPGIAEADLPHVFERFYKADKSHSTKGSGLGLSIARELLRWMGEDIWVKSKLGEGTEFAFTIHREKAG